MSHKEIDDDRTGAQSANGMAPTVFSASAVGQHDNLLALPVGTRVAEFEILGLVGAGGFGIVYLARDCSLNRRVALKEYMPSSMACRIAGGIVSVKSVHETETFDLGLRSFVNEARLLAQFEHPSLVKVYRFWEANGTAYMVMPFYEGLTLKQSLKVIGAPPSEDWLLNLLMPLIDALKVMHQANCFHRDIAPDNILLVQGGGPVLLDFGAARRVIVDKTSQLTVILKPGYAPVEQYASDDNMRQGAWTDIYALAAVIRYAITGEPPIPSVGRMINDTMLPLAQLAKGRYSEGFLRCVDMALAVRAEQRPQSVEELRTMLGWRVDAAQSTLTTQAHKSRKPPTRSLSMKRGLLIGIAFTSMMIGIAAWDWIDLGDKPTEQRPTKIVVPAATTAMADTPASPVTQSMSASRQAAGQALGPLDAMSVLFEGRDPQYGIEVFAEQKRVRIGKEKLRFHIDADRSGFVYVMMVGTANRHFHLLFPNALDGNNKIVAGKSMPLPASGWSMTAEGPPGTNHFIVLISPHPRDFAGTGLVKNGAFGEVPLDMVERLLKTNLGDQLAGKPICPDAGNCAKTYGAARFSIDEID